MPDDNPWQGQAKASTFRRGAVLSMDDEAIMPYRAANLGRRKFYSGAPANAINTLLNARSLTNTTNLLFGAGGTALVDDIHGHGFSSLSTIIPLANDPYGYGISGLAGDTFGQLRHLPFSRTSFATAGDLTDRRIYIGSATAYLDSDSPITDHFALSFAAGQNGGRWRLSVGNGVAFAFTDLGFAVTINTFYFVELWATPTMVAVRIIEEDAAGVQTDRGVFTRSTGLPGAAVQLKFLMAPRGTSQAGGGAQQSIVWYHNWYDQIY